MKHYRTGMIILVAATLTSLPYGIAAWVGGSEFVFGGFLLNPIDGNSYLAKMYQGWEGSWHFTLPYTAETSTGSYLFLFYLSLGHLARITGLSLLVTFHLARILSGIVLGFALFRFYQQVIPERRLASTAFFWALFGAGLGWLAFPFAYLTSDYWVAEAFPFLSTYANPHFSLALGLILWLFTLSNASLSWKQLGLIGGASLALALILPFGSVLVLVVLGGKGIWDWLETGQIRWKIPTLIACASFPILVYQLWVTWTDPILAAWNAQNLTPSPPIWDLILSFSPALVLAIFGIRGAVRRKTEGDRLLAAWAVLGLLMMYLPVGLQRRFMLGLYIPLVGLALLGLRDAVMGNQRWLRRGTVAAMVLSFPTILLILAAGIFGIASHQPAIYLTRGESQVLAWLAVHTPPETVILASPDMGLLIPAYSGRRVLYGHPFETTDAPVKRSALESFFDGNWDSQKVDFLSQNQVDYLLIGPRERMLGDFQESAGYPIAYQVDEVILYEISPEP